MHLERFTAAARRLLIRANVAMLGMIGLHDADHVRQAANWCYSIPLSLWIINIAVYVPGCLALWLSVARHRLMAVATASSALLITVLFLKVHLWQTSLAIWGIWNKNFFALGADWISWTILAALALTGLTVGLIGLREEARSSYEHPAIPW